jgi:LAS superfamily LD-carboxypeptidase LdcB
VPTAEELTGCSDRHILHEPFPGGIARPVHPEIVEAFHGLQVDAAQAGFDLQIISGFRGYQRQLDIWNAKAGGLREVLDDKGEVISFFDEMSDRDKVFRILRWSALPGASRHHWGTDIDVYDAAACPANYRVRLVPEECLPGGIFSALHAWLAQRIASGGSYGFFRPYAGDHGGIAPEPWHLSYAPIADGFQEYLTAQRLAAFLAGQEFALKETVLANWEEIHDRFILVPGRL